MKIPTNRIPGELQGLMHPSESSTAIRFRPFGVSYVTYPGLVFFDLENQDLELGDPLSTIP